MQLIIDEILEIVVIALPIAVITELLATSYIEKFDINNWYIKQTVTMAVNLWFVYVIADFIVGVNSWQILITVALLVMAGAEFMYSYLDKHDYVAKEDNPVDDYSTDIIDGEQVKG